MHTSHKKAALAAKKAGSVNVVDMVGEGTSPLHNYGRGCPLLCCSWFSERCQEKRKRYGGFFHIAQASLRTP